MNSLIPGAMLVLASLSSYFSRRVYFHVACFLCFGEPDFTQIEADLFSEQ